MPATRTKVGRPAGPGGVVAAVEGRFTVGDAAADEQPVESGGFVEATDIDLVTFRDREDVAQVAVLQVPAQVTAAAVELVRRRKVPVGGNPARQHRV